MTIHKHDTTKRQRHRHHTSHHIPPPPPKQQQQDLLACEQAGRDMAVQVKRRLKARERGAMGAGAAAVSANSAQLAMGRVVGSLCVVAARDEDATSAMLVRCCCGAAAAAAAALRLCVDKEGAPVGFFSCQNQASPTTTNATKHKNALNAGLLGVPGVVRPARPDRRRQEGPRDVVDADPWEQVCDVDAVRGQRQGGDEGATPRAARESLFVFGARG